MMPKSTATSLPSASTNRLPGCMSAWKKPSRSAWRRKVWITRAAERLQVEARRLERGAVGQRHAVDPFERQHVARGAVPVDRRHAEIGIVPGVLRHLGERGGLQPQVHLDRDGARAACRRPRSAAAGAPRPRCARRCAPRNEGVEIGREAPLDAGPQHLHRDARRPSAAISARCTCAIEAAATAGPNDANSFASGRPSASATAAPPRPAGTAPSGPAAISRSRASASPTTSGRVARNWPSFT